MIEHSVTVSDPEGLTPTEHRMALQFASDNTAGTCQQAADALSVTQATELGTVYAVEEIAALVEVARRHGLKVHMDGARFANAVASLGCAPADLSWRAGVDVLCFGGVKNGLAVGEAVLFFERELAWEFEWRVKQAGHLNLKMRLVTG